MHDMVMMGLGGYRFGLSTAAFQSLTRDVDLGWQSVPRAANLPSYQNTSLGSESVELKGIIYPHFRGGIAQIAAMRAQARQRVPLPLVTGYGEWLGLWIMMKVSETQGIFISSGAPRKQEFTVSLEFKGAT